VGTTQAPETYTLTVTGSLAEAKRWEGEADALGRDPKALEKLWMSGILFDGLDAQSDAARVFTKIYTRFPSDRRSGDAALRAGVAFKIISRYPDAASAFQTLLSKYSQSDLVPFAYFELIDVLIAQHKWDDANREAANFRNTCRRGGNWHLESRAPELVGQVEDMLTESEALPGIIAQNAADQSGKPEDYAKAVKLYRDFLAAHATDFYAYRVNYLLAQCLLDAGEERAAAQEYLNTAQGYSDDAKYRVNLQEDFTRADAANNAVYHFYHAWQAELADIAARVGQDKLQAAEASLVANAPLPVRIVPPSELSQGLLDAANFFLEKFPKDYRASDVLAVKGEVLFWYGDYAASRQVYKKVLDDYPGTEADFAAAENIALSYLIERNYPEATTWYDYVLKLGQAKHREVVTRRAELMLGGVELEKVSAMPGVKAGDDKANEKAHITAAKDYLKVAEKSKVQDVTDLARLRGAEQYLLANKYSDAEKTLNKIIEEKSKSRFLWNAYYGLGELNLKTRKYDKAEAYYKTALENVGENAAGIAEVHFALARIYREQKRTADCLRELEGLANSRYAAPADIAQAYYLQGQVMQESGNRDGANGRWGNAFLYFSELVQKGNPDPAAAYWAGKARLETAGDYESRAAAEKLTGDDAKDRQIFTRKLDYYGRARDACYDALRTRNAPVMAEALTRLGGIYENLSEDILDTPRPSGLKPDEVKLYDAALKGNMNPLIEKAIQAYSKCVSMADALKYEDEWTKRSTQRLTELVARGADAATARAAISTDSTWKAAGLVSDSTWVTAGFDDADWSQARDVTPVAASGNDLLNGGGRQIWGSPGDSKVYLRSRLEVSTVPASQPIVVDASGAWQMWINGSEVARGVAGKSNILNVAPDLVRGTNTVAVQVETGGRSRDYFTITSQ
jgi:TolA-binding protein